MSRRVRGSSLFYPIWLLLMGSKHQAKGLLETLKTQLSAEAYSQAREGAQITRSEKGCRRDPCMSILWKIKNRR